MHMDFSFLDYVWRGLVVGILTSGIAFLIMFLIGFFLNQKSSSLQMKKFFNCQLLLVLFIFTASFVWVSIGDPELAIGCFNQFANASVNYTITRMLAGAWVLTVVLFFIRDTFKIYFASIKSEKLQRLEIGSIQEQFKRCLFQLGLKHIELRTTQTEISPFVCGIFSYKVVIPIVVINSLSAKSLQSIFYHELIHVRDRDPLWLYLELFCRRLLFFNPLVYQIRKQYLLVVEKAADEEAIKKGGIQVSDLLNSLVEVISLCKSKHPNPMVLSVSRSFHELKQRMEALSQIQRFGTSARIFNAVMIASVIFSLGFSIAQAQLAVADLSEQSHSLVQMCSQLQHEKLIESWLNMETALNKCEK